MFIKKKQIKKNRKEIVTMRLLNKLSKRKHGISKKMHLMVVSVWDNIWSRVCDSGMDRDNE